MGWNTGSPAISALPTREAAPPMRIQLVLADDHPIVLEGLSGLLALEPDMYVQARCRTGEEALRSVDAHRPDVLLLDIALPDMDGIEVLRRILARDLPTRVVLLTAAISDEQVLESIRLGVQGVLLKELASEYIVRCIRKVHGGGRWVETRSLGKALDRLVNQDNARQQIAAHLSVREREVMDLVITGLCNKEIATRLFISEGTVKIHLHHIFEKLNVRTRLQLAAYARDKRLV
jgi:two-component system, NarL family, nitrate/nitrite response regulator NarL